MNTRIANHAEQAEPVAWRTPAAAWLRQLADQQRKTNAAYPEHVKCYPSWEKRVRDLEWLADDLEREQAAPATSSAAAEQEGQVAQTSAEWERRFLAHDPSRDPAEAECDIPPHGWRCTRAKGHDGPCAAVAAPDDVALVRRSMARLAAAEQAETVAEVRDPHFGGSSYEASMLRELLARIHGDGGHYVAEHGLDKALESADRLVAEWRAAPPAPAAAEQAPIDMVLHCPACGEQHIDAPDHPHYGGKSTADGFEPRWDNPPHRSHLCHGCGHIWRPADVPTNGVAAIKTKGKADSPPAPAPTWPEWAEQILKTVREYSGYDGYDDADGVDLPEEVREALEELTTQIERLEAKAPAPARQEWQPIGTAPKDQFVLVSCPSGYTTIPRVSTIAIMRSNYKAGRWIDHANDDLTDWGMVPTHWKPRPADPAEGDA